jgi:predicted outer membrane repeat protein
LNSTPAIVTDCIVRNNHAVRFGGGFDLYAVAPVITNTLFENNLADSGGGGASAHLSFDSFHGPPCAPEACKAVFEDCTFRDNTATNGGGFLATYSSRPVLRRVLFENNSVSTFGGGMHHNGIGGPLFFDDPQAGWASLSECTFRGNSAGTGGGAIQAQGGSDLTAVRCDFWGNSAVGNGGAMDINYHSRATVFNSRFVGNWIPANNGNWGSGGAIIASSEVELLVANSLFSGNSSDYNGGAAVVQLASTATIVNSTFTGNTCVQFGGALLASSDSSVQLVNSIAWDSQAAQGTTLFGASLNVSHSTVEGGWPGVGNVADDPKFVDPDGADNIPGTEDDDPTLAWDSPALNVAAAGYLPADATDLDNDGDVAEPIPVDLDEEARMYGTGLDMGAVELGPTQCPPGMFSATGAPPCTPCSPGSAQPSAGATQCLPCAPGTIAPSSGAAACTPCSTGNYQPSSGATACLPCGCDDADACTINGCDAVSGDCEYPPIPGCSIPTVSAWGLAVFSLLLLIAGTVLAHRRQREVNGFVTANVRGPCRRNLA